MSKTLETHVKVAEGGTIHKIKAPPRDLPEQEPDSPPVFPVGFWEDEIRNTTVAGGKITTIPIPLESIVGPDALGELVDNLKKNLDLQLALEVVGVHGRVAILRPKHGRSLPPWHQLLGVLVGTDGMCEDFHIVKGKGKERDQLFAKLLTAAQREAKCTAQLLDEVFNAQVPRSGAPMHTWLQGIFSHALELIDDTQAPEKHTRAAKRKRKVPPGASQFVMRAMEQQHKSGAVEIEELVDEVVPTMPPKIDSEGKNRTTRYIRSAIEKLVALDLLYLHNGSQVSLLPVVSSDE